MMSTAMASLTYYSLTKVRFSGNENPTWVKHVIAKDLTERDNVCIAAKDIDGDGKCEIAIGGQWNYRESLKDGAIHYPATG